jgi:hypothetical protein
MEPEHTSATQAGENSGGERRAPPQHQQQQQQQQQQAPPRAAAARPDFYQGRDHPPIRIPDASAERQSTFKAASSGLTSMAHQDVFLGKFKSNTN